MWNKSKKYIIGSGIVALACRKILGSDWNIIPFGPSRFYTDKVSWGDNYILYDNTVADLIVGWSLDKTPILYKRPFSYGGRLIYNTSFVDEYISRLGIDSDKMLRPYFKTDFTVFNFSSTALWKYLVTQNIDNIKSFYSQYKDVKGIDSIKDNRIIFKSENSVIDLEYDQLISTIPYNSFANMTNLSNGEGIQCYYYIIKDDKIDIEKANQVLICDSVIPFNKCTKLKNNIYMVEVYNDYYDKPYDVFSPVFGNSFEILETHTISDAIMKPFDINMEFVNNNNIVLIGSNAQCDPLMDISSCIKRIGNLLNKNQIMIS